MMTEDNMKAVRKASRLLSQLRTSIAPNIPAQVLQTFLTVAMHEGKTLTEISEMVGSNLSTVSRQLLELGERNRRKEPGFNLVASRNDPQNLRQNSYTLTPKGKLLISEIVRLMED